MFGAAKVTRALRFRLALSYVLFFTVLLAAIGLVFRQNLKSETEAQVQMALEETWDGAKAFLTMVGGEPVWKEDTNDSDQNFLKARLRLVHLITDRFGFIRGISPPYAAIGADDPARIRRIIDTGVPEIYVREDRDGTPYLIKAGRIYGNMGNPYFFAIGRSLESSVQTVDNFTRDYFLLLPFLVALSGLLGWLLAGRALRPLNAVSKATQAVTGSNLKIAIPQRGADDELDRLIDSFNQMTARLHESFEQIRQFSTDVSHELRTPLTAIRGQLEVALFTAQTQEQYREAMFTALEAVEQLSSIVRALLLLSQAESGQVVLQRNPVDLGDLARDAVEQFQIPAEEKQLVITSWVESTLDQNVVVLGDRVQLERLVNNLLSNALKYTPEGGSIQVTARTEGTFGVLEVEDNGVGIPKENLPHIFDRFYRVRGQETNPIQGLGLGLSFVAWIAKAHGGNVEVASAVGKGTRFTVRIPLPPAGTVEAAPESQEAARPALH